MGELQSSAQDPARRLGSSNLRAVGHVLGALALGIGVFALISYGAVLWATPTPEQRFVDPVPGGADVALEDLGFSLLGTRHFAIEDSDSAGTAWVSHFVEMGETGCDVDDLECVRGLFAGSTWVDETSPNDTSPADVVSFRFMVGDCSGSGLRFANDDPFPPLGDVEVVDAWRVTVRCKYG